MNKWLPHCEFKFTKYICNIQKFNLTISFFLEHPTFKKSLHEDKKFILLKNSSALRTQYLKVECQPYNVMRAKKVKLCEDYHSPFYHMMMIQIDEITKARLNCYKLFSSRVTLKYMKISISIANSTK